jgi:hypothetical protein
MNQIKKLFGVKILCLCALSGCADFNRGMENSRLQREAKALETSQMARAKVLNIAASDCEGYGFKKGTTQFSQCVMTLDQQGTNRAIMFNEAQAQSRRQMLQDAERLIAPTNNNVRTCHPSIGAPSGTLICN